MRKLKLCILHSFGIIFEYICTRSSKNDTHGAAKVLLTSSSLRSSIRCTPWLTLPIT